ncbi:MAG: serine/threonine-protein kinase PknK [Acidobacteria bacterium]|nr:serine/threonine-protein kinase PknK [Acidobacteriota bacterium]
MSVSSFPYQVIEEYVKGGCSIIYKIKPTGSTSFSGKQFVLKCMLPDDDDPSADQRFYMEYEFLRAYPHPNLVEVREYVPDWNGNPAYVMEWVEGQTWQAFWQDKDVFEHLKIFLEHIRELCEVLDFIHKHHIVHRDLKPQNILIDPSQVVKLIDFGIMKVENLTLYTNRNTFMGSAYYVAPECLSGDEVNYAADIFSLGVMIYDMLTGTKPFRGHTLAETVYQRLVTQPKPPSQLRDLPKEIDTFMERILHKEPHKRFGSGAEVFIELDRILGNAQPQTDAQPSPPIDLVSKGAFLHSHFLDHCRDKIIEKNVVFIQGDVGSGKSTLAENLAQKVAPDAVIKITCNKSLNQIDFMELVIKNISLPSKADPDIKPWINIIGSVLPQLGWKVPNYDQQIHESSILSAFINLIRASQHPFAILIDDVDLASETFHKFLRNITDHIANRDDGRVHMIMTGKQSVPELGDKVELLPMSFPDVLTISDYLASQFGDCRVPLEAVMQLIEESGENIQAFLDLIPKLKGNNTLFVQDGTLCFIDIRIVETKPMKAKSNIPEELSEFSHEQLNHLEWVALSPSGLDLKVLQKVADATLDKLAITLKKADELGLLDYSASGMEGFRWKKKNVKDFLVDSYSSSDRKKRYNKIAETMERETEAFLPYSPPLWLILSELFHKSDKDEKAAKYAVDYARYCFQNANYEPVRNILKPYVAYPALQSNQEFWSMLALAHRHTDPSQALKFAKRALAIDQNINSLSLNAILEYDQDNADRVNELISQAYSDQFINQVDVHSSTQLIPILVAMGYQDRADRLVKKLESQLSSRSDLFASNIIALVETQRLQAQPQQLVNYWQNKKIELLPQNESAIAAMRYHAYIQLFQLAKAHETMSTFADGFVDRTDRETARFRESLFLYLNFMRAEDLRKLIARINTSKASHEHLASLTPLCQLITELLLRDAKIFQYDHLMESLGDLGSSAKAWLSSFLAAMRPDLISPEGFEAIYDKLTSSPSAFVRLQIPRIRLVRNYFKNGQSLDKPFREAVDYAINNKLNMELLRLDALREFLIAEDRLNPALSSQVPIELSQMADARATLNTLRMFFG